MTRDVEIGLPAEIVSDVLGRAPISVMDENLAVVGQTVPGQTIALDPGFYAARTVLPDGREFETAFDVPAQGPIEPVVLTDLKEFDEMLAALSAQAEGLVMRTMKLVPAAFGHVVSLTSGAAQAIAAKLEARRTSLLLVSVDPASGETHGCRELDSDGERKIDIEPSTDRRLLRLECIGRADMNMAIPTSPTEGVRIRYAPGTDMPIDVRLQDEDAELMRRYLSGGQAQQLVQTLESQRDRAREMLQGKFERPIAATVGAYVMLSVGPPPARTDEDFTEADWLDRWTANLFDGFPWLPDGICVHAELLGRKGDHEAALATLAELRHRGYPLFSLGLRFALDRLSAYRAAAAAGSLPAERAPMIDSLLAYLSEVAVYTDFSQPLLTFTTSPDGRPGNQVRESRDALLDHASAPAPAPVPAPMA